MLPEADAANMRSRLHEQGFLVPSDILDNLGRCAADRLRDSAAHPREAFGVSWPLRRPDGSDVQDPVLGKICSL